MIKCPNPECQAINPEGHDQCASCQTYLPHRYLWAARSGRLVPEHLDKRYVWKHQQIVLDTEPGAPPASPEPVPAHIWPYLMLAAHGLHVPQPYALLNPGTGRETLLLDTAAIAIAPGDTKPKLLPSLPQAWPAASPLRQLNWLWQIAGLWSDFVEQQVASSLLSGDLLRVHGSLVRLLELAADVQPLTLNHLGTFWQTLIPKAQPAIRDFLENLCTQLVSGEIVTPAGLIDCLDQAIALSAQGYQADYGMAVITDQGPSRKRNEDACYPTSGTSQTHGVGPKAKHRHQRPLLLLVCDGIGGHEGGDVASQLAISTIQQRLSPLLEQLAKQPEHDSIAVTEAIKAAIYAANDNISQHNDQGHRQARDRMGTTLVMTLIIGVQIYIAHVGDSRAYRISPNSCRQITFDDDVAAREVRLGYGFYADVVNRPGTGALIQALGMGHSTALHVAIQRLVLDSDIVLLLCSDGLSDYDRVEQSWPTHLLPVLTGESKPATAVANLVQLANTYNGHDNVTVGVVVGHIQAFKPPTIPLLSPSQPPPTETAQTQPTPVDYPTVIAQAPPATPQKAKKAGSWLVLLGFVGFLGTAAALAFVYFRQENTTTPPDAAAPSLPETIQDKIDQDIEAVGITDDELANPLLTPRSYLQLSQSVELLRGPQTTGEDANILGQLPNGAIVQVLTRQEPAAQEARWVKLQVCAISPIEPSNDQATSPPQETALPVSPSVGSSGPPTSDSSVTMPGSPPLNSGAVGWVLEAQLAKVARAAEARNCPTE
ncbi:protein serine threonine phosphatase [Leptolyngbya sp. Heron Island J]|uniref:PP2C family protein-serine/threonine phosphatase n=1 Tax=Leptolyngbya sp. Heron Island J TaxID=1385935 RepID=UPI0003B99469|nr:protein phosphatase 2C domain-containing protein [Leptolyngbya sp. Heron Island J]ESA35900.1 protein serine threonine phosphatase [Leptolyngbya sp. Heron Island J]